MKSYSINEWCKLHGFSRAYFYKLSGNGGGPRTFKVGRLTRISDVANNEWIAEREAASRKVAA